MFLEQVFRQLLRQISGQPEKNGLWTDLLSEELVEGLGRLGCIAIEVLIKRTISVKAFRIIKQIPELKFFGDSSFVVHELNEALDQCVETIGRSGE